MYLVHQLCNLRDEEERSIHCDTHIIQTLLIHQLGYLIRVFLVGFFLCHCIASYLPRCRLTYAPFSRLYKNKSNVTEQRPQFLYTWNVFPIELHMYWVDIMLKIYIRLKFFVLFAQSEKNVLFIICK